MESPHIARHRIARKSGFTIIELLVVGAIIAILSGIVISHQSTFNRTLVLANTAYDVALAVRAAETYGIGSRAAGTSLNAGFGIHFDKTPADTAVPAIFLLFADTNSPDASSCHGLPQNGADAPDALPGNCVYDGSSEQVTTYQMNNGMTVHDLCGYSGVAWTCGLTSLDVVFARPNPQPFIRAQGDANTAYSKACISIAAPEGDTRSISVLASGSVSATTNPCPWP